MNCTIREAKTKALISFAVSNREADLRLCFRICKKPVFSKRGSNKSSHDTKSLLLAFADLAADQANCCSLLQHSSYNNHKVLYPKFQDPAIVCLAILHKSLCNVWFEANSIENPKSRFSPNETPIFKEKKHVHGKTNDD